VLGVSDNDGFLVGSDASGVVVWTTSGNVTNTANTTLANQGSFLPAISGDGMVVVGQTAAGVAAKWTAPFGGQPQTLPFGGVANAMFSTAIGVNTNATFIVGTITNPATGNNQVTEWAISGTTVTTTDVNTALAAAPNLSSFQFSDVRFVSLDGKMICGQGVVNGNTQTLFPWVARLP